MICGPNTKWAGHVTFHFYQFGTYKYHEECIELE
jgi:hypothetical protein